MRSGCSGRSRKTKRARLLEKLNGTPFGLAVTSNKSYTISCKPKNFEMFLPKINIWSRRGGLRCLTQVPLFPGYLFIRHAIDKHSHNEICKTRGLVRILGERWDRLASIPEKEIEGIKRVLDSRLHAMPHAYVREGQRVRISRGPLKDVEGMLLKIKPEKGLFVVSVDLLQRSVAVEIDCTLIVAA